MECGREPKISNESRKGIVWSLLKTGQQKVILANAYLNRLGRKVRPEMGMSRQRSLSEKSYSVVGVSLLPFWTQMALDCFEQKHFRNGASYQLEANKGGYLGGWRKQNFQCFISFWFLNDVDGLPITNKIMSLFLKKWSLLTWIRRIHSFACEKQLPSQGCFSFGQLLPL